MQTLTLIRGIPGSGKSTLAKQLSALNGLMHVEADQFFVNSSGIYTWQSHFVATAHNWCRDYTDNCLLDKTSVVVSNTFTTIKELRPYFVLAKNHGVTPRVITCQNQFMNVHAVPEETLRKMKTRFQYDISELFEEFA